MRSVNKVTLIGHLTRDPELRQITSGQNVSSFSLATNRVWSDASGNRQEATDYHDCVAWGKLAEIVDQYVTKGMAVYIEGRLSQRTWEAQDGTKRKKTEIVVTDLNMLTAKGNTPDGGPAPKANPAPSSAPSYKAPTSGAPIGNPEATAAPANDKIDVDEILDF